ncbi:MAG: hypothetical protein LBS21_02215 [Clostridiales bacterium]|jgi:uncharacterized protein|nr:hypothetical protein [Clostridiales bacterium]
MGKAKANSKREMFNNCVEDLADLPEVQKLADFSQHLNTSRLKHCLNVSYYSYRVCKKFGWNYKAAARAGLLHDFYLYDWRVEKRPEGHHAKAHPQVALKNAREITNLNAIEEDAIVKHMWPITIAFPRYKESYVVSFTDKICAGCEVMNYYGVKIKTGVSKVKWLFGGKGYAR